jgi:parvulin-like peptidyl-prolyl isomerase
MKLKLIILLLLLSLKVKSQSLTEAMSKIETADQLKEVQKHDPRFASANFVYLNSYDDSSEIARKLLKSEKGAFIESDSLTCRVVSTETGTAYKASYIYLDGSKMTMSAINKTRKGIIEDYNNGTPFFALVKKHTMDGNPTGELSWFYEATMVKEFSTAVKNHKKGDLFTVDVPGKKWYYVTLKTHDDITLTRTKVLGVKH